MKKAMISDLALKHISVKGNVIGKFSSFEIEQTYCNITNKVLEVNYTFPIVDTATITGFIATIGEKVIKGKVLEKEKALKTYQQNITKGNSAYLMEQETKNIFNIFIGKIAPKEEVKIKIMYIDKLEVVDNTLNLLIPTLVTPKYKSTITGKKVYGNPEYTVDFNIKVSDVISVEEIKSPTHKISFKKEDRVYNVVVANCLLNKDFVLNIKLVKGLISNGIKSKTKDNGEIIHLAFMPEIEDKYEDKEREYLFLIDVSGSMYGLKLDETKKAVKQCLRNLDTGDKFNLIAFESEYSVLDMEALEYCEENLEKANTWIDNLCSTGGTEIMNPIKFALYDEHIEKVILLFTDGQVGNEAEIISYVRSNIKDSRLFAFGIDTNINTSFIREMSETGNGRAEFIHLNEKIEDKIIRTFARIQSPLLRDIKFDFGKNNVIDQIKEGNVLFNYEFFNAFVKVDKLVDDIKLTGKILDTEYSWVIKKEDIISSECDLELIWVKQLINRLEVYEQDNSSNLAHELSYKQQIIELSEQYNINSKYTSFISVYERKDKLEEIPVQQDIILHQDPVLETSRNGSFLDRMSSMWCDMSSDSDEVAADDYKPKEPNYIDMADSQIKSYYLKYKDELEDEKRITRYILLALYYVMLNDKNEFDYQEFINFIIKNKNQVNSDEKNALLLIKYYEYLSNKNDRLNELVLQIFNDKYKKILFTRVKTDDNFEKPTVVEFKDIVINNKIEDQIEDLLMYIVYNRGRNIKIPNIFC